MDLDLNSTIKLNNKTLMPRLGLGVYQTPDGPETYKAVKWALEAGYRHIDTAKLYRNEASVGRAVRESGIDRSQIWVTTKLWPTNFGNVEKAFETSLEKLGLDYIDLYLVHFPIPGMTRRVWKQMERIYDSKRAKAIGVSNYSETQLADTIQNASVLPSVNQVKCSVFGYNHKLYDLCQKEGIVFEAYSPLGRGKNLDNAKLSQMAGRYKKSSAQLMLRWALQKNMVVIPKSVHQERIIENAELFDFSISQNDMKLLDLLSE